ncbi:MAG TPA: alpha/beta hydrolase [Sphingobium sp.]
MFDGFRSERIVLPDGLSIHARIGGKGPPVLLLHGYPQTSACWHAVAPKLVAAGYSVIAPDLRGYGASDKPASAGDHSLYSKRAMAADQVALMRQLGFDRFHVAGHDRGGRVAHRLALDYPDCVQRIVVLDIAPTATMYDATDTAFATGYYHWFFLIQPAPLPEKLIGADPDFYLKSKLAAWGRSGMDVYTSDAMDEYCRAFRDPACISATCEDYRAAATIDLTHDAADQDQRIAAPLLALWGTKGLVGRLFDVPASWRAKATTVTGQGLPVGHFLPEEAAVETAAALVSFFSP